MPQDLTISCVICAYNEEKTIHHTLDALKGVDSIREVIVVDDGSKDRTAAIVREYPRVRLVSLDPNRGKSFALAQGLSLATGSHILMLDADLIGLNAGDVRTLIAPVVSGTSDVSMSLRANSLPLYRWIGIDFVSGERIFPRSIIESHIETIRALPGFALETFINTKVIEKQLRISIVYWSNVFNKRKAEKIGWWRGTTAELKMVRDILRFTSPMKLLSQNHQLLKLTRATSRSRTA